MKTIRKGSDIVVRWRIFRYGQEYDIALYRESISLVLSNMGEKKEITDYSIVDVNTIVFKYRAEDQGLGIYRLLLIDKSRNSTRIIEECNAFRLVNTSDAANNDGTLESAITITLTSELTAPADGLSAYEVALQNGFIGTEEEWLQSLKGEQGPQGIQGDKGDKGDRGEQGEKGLSAYQVAIANGFVGTEAEWLQSLVPDTTDIELAEAQRQAKELERIEAENARQSAELERQNASTEAVASANEAASNANEAAITAQQKAGEANAAASSANNAASSANAVVAEFNSIIVQETGAAQDKVMSQKAVTDAMTASQAKLSELEQDIHELNATLQDQSRNFENYSERLSADGVTIGKYRIYDGTLGGNSAYFYSNPILLHKGESIVASLDAVIDVVAVLSVVDEENNWVSLIQRGATPTEVSYTATDDIYIGISALKSQMDSFVINRIATTTRMQTAIDDNTAGIKQNASDISRNTKSIREINKSLESASYQLGADDKIIGKYRVINGSLASSSAYFYTNPIKLHKGDRIVITDANIVTQVAIISEVDANNNFISVIYAGQAAVASYTFTASRDMLIGLSALNSQAGTIAIETNGVFQRLTADEEDISDLQKTLTNTTRGLETPDVVIGKYRVINGSLASSSAYFYTNPIKLHKGDRIATDTAIPTYSGVSYITQVDEGNNFIEVLRPGTKETEIIDFTIPRDGYFSISALKSQIDFFVIYQNGIESRIDGLMADVSIIFPALDTKLPAITDNPLSSIRRDAGYGAIIRKWGIIGDSLSSGEMQCYDNTSTSASDYKFLDMYQYSWGQVFARIIGADAYNFSNGGQTTWGWLKGQGVIHDDSYIGGIGGGDWDLAKQDAYKKDAYIIALGVNDRAKIASGDYVLGATSQIVSYDGTDSDIDDISVNPKSFVRYYAGIIQRVKSIQPKAKIFCVTPLGSKYAEIAQAIRDIVEYYSSDGVYLIDLFNYIPEGYNVDGYMLNGHLSPMGYVYTAYMMNTYIDWIIRNNGSAFRDTALIGTEYRPD